MRVFIGIKLDCKYKLKLENIRKFLFQNGVNGNYTSYNNIHLTLSFIGDVDSKKIMILKEIINNIDVNGLELEVTNIEEFKTYLILKVKKTDMLLNIQKTLVSKLIDNGFSVDDKEYFPHITLIRKPTNLNKELIEKLNEKIYMKSIVEKIHLFESTRINGELKYIVL